MERETLDHLDFGDAARLDRSLSPRVRGLTGSEILKIAADIRELIRQGHEVCNLTVGDFDSAEFPIPEALRQEIVAALERGETNYPPSDGVRELREAVTEYVERAWGVRYPVASVLIASGARPLLYASYISVLETGARVVYPVPSWNNNHYAWLAGAEAVEIPTRREDRFMPRLEQLRPHLPGARLLCLNSPLNPTGTVMDPAEVRAITEALVEQNAQRRREGKPELFLLHDQVYAALTFGEARHVHPVALVPEAAPWVISLDAVSKAFAATGLRVGWALAAPPVIARMADLIGHVGAWAPRPEQVAVARFLRRPDAVEAFMGAMRERVLQRLERLYRGFEALRREGYPVECIYPQGAIYLSLRLDLIGRAFRGKKLESNEAIRQVLLQEAGVAVVPFQAFGLRPDTGWFRLSVGAVSLEAIDAAFPRLRRLLDAIE